MGERRLSTGERLQARQAAADTFSPVVEMRCQANSVLVDERIRDRRHRADPSDATPEIARLMEQEFPSWPEATPIDTTAPLEQTVEQALRRLRPY